MDTTGDYDVSSASTVHISRAEVATLQYYVSQAVDTNDLKGIAAFVLASVEYENAIATKKMESGSKKL